MKINDTHKELISHISLECIKNNVTFVLSASKSVKMPDEPDKFQSSGFFDEDARMLVVAVNRPLFIWFTTLLHEYNHMLQWIEGKFSSEKFNDAGCDIWEWMDHKIEMENSEVIEKFNLVREFEKDCEIRTWKMLIENPEVGDPDLYVRMANIYLYFYTIARRVRRWYKRSPFLVKEGIAMMPTKFMNDYNRVPRKFQKLMLDKCF